MDSWVIEEEEKNRESLLKGSTLKLGSNQSHCVQNAYWVPGRHTATCQSRIAWQQIQTLTPNSWATLSKFLSLADLVSPGVKWLQEQHPPVGLLQEPNE